MKPKQICAFKEVLTDRNANKARAQVTRSEVSKVTKLFCELEINKSKLFWKANQVRFRAAMASGGNQAINPEKSEAPRWIHVATQKVHCASDRGRTPAR